MPSESNISTKIASIFRRRRQQKTKDKESLLEVGMDVYRRGVTKAKEDNWEEALLAWQHSLEALEGVLGKDHRIIAKIYNKIGVAYYALGAAYKYEAYEAFQEALTIQQKSLQPGDKDLVETLDNICHLLRLEKKRAEKMDQSSVSTTSTSSMSG